MASYQITNRSTGTVLGIYEGETREDALEAYARDAGYASFAAAAEVAGEDADLELELVPALDHDSSHDEIDELFRAATDAGREAARMDRRGGASAEGMRRWGPWGDGGWSERDAFELVRAQGGSAPLTMPWSETIERDVLERFARAYSAWVEANVIDEVAS